MGILLVELLLDQLAQLLLVAEQLAELLELLLADAAVLVGVELLEEPLTQLLEQLRFVLELALAQLGELLGDLLELLLRQLAVLVGVEELEDLLGVAGELPFRLALLVVGPRGDGGTEKQREGERQLAEHGLIPDPATEKLTPACRTTTRGV